MVSTDSLVQKSWDGISAEMNVFVEIPSRAYKTTSVQLMKIGWGNRRAEAKQGGPWQCQVLVNPPLSSYPQVKQTALYTISTLTSVPPLVHIINLLCENPRLDALPRLTATCSRDACNQVQASMARCFHDSGLVAHLSGASMFGDSSFARGTRQTRRQQRRWGRWLSPLPGVPQEDTICQRVRAPSIRANRELCRHSEPSHL